MWACPELPEVGHQAVVAQARLLPLLENRMTKAVESAAWRCSPKAEAEEEVVETLLPEISTLGRSGSRRGRSSFLVLRSRVTRL